MTRIFVAGHKGMVGSAICRQLHNQDVDLVTASRHELDLTNQNQVNDFFSTNKFDQVYLAAAKVGGIHANNIYPADFIYQNLMIQNNIIHQSYISGVEKLLFLGSSCIYPKYSTQPIAESELLNGYLEPTNEPYAIAKVAGIKTCESYNRQYGTDFRSIMPTNLYGPGDNFHHEHSHVVPALIRRFHEAKTSGEKSVTAWGSGTPRREFLYVDDMANASIYIMNLEKKYIIENTEPMLSHINVGAGVDYRISELIEIIARIVGFDGEINFDASRPDGPSRKLLKVDRLKSLGWSYSVSLEDGLTKSYQWFLENQSGYRR